MRRDIDDALHDWPYDPEPGETVAREIQARDGRTVLQVRQELGILQMEVDGRPDGERPHGFRTYLDYLRHRATNRGPKSRNRVRPWVLAPEHFAEVDREFIQFYHRRMAWLALQRYDRMLQDADHTLDLMDFVHRHSDDEDFITSHERFRGLVIFHRTQAAAAIALEDRRADQAIDAIREGASRLRDHQEDWDEEFDEDEIPDQALIDQLHLLEREIRHNFGVGPTLREQLDEAVSVEDYERAAKLRDQIRAQGRA